MGQLTSGLQFWEDSRGPLTRTAVRGQLELGLCPQRKYLPSQPLELLQLPASPPAFPCPLMPAAVIRRMAISTTRQTTSCKQTKQSPMKQGCMAELQRKQILSPLFSLSPWVLGMSSQKCLVGYLDHPSFVSKNHLLGIVESKAWLEYMPCSNSVRQAHYCGTNGHSYKMG